MSSGPSNREICAAFRELLTTRFHVLPEVPPDEGLRITKPWRGEVWKAFREIEDRLCPLDALTREKEKNK